MTPCNLVGGTEITKEFSAFIFIILWRGKHLTPLRPWCVLTKLFHLKSLETVIFTESSWISRCRRLVWVISDLSAVAVHLRLQVEEAQEPFVFHQTVECWKLIHTQFTRYFSAFKYFSDLIRYWNSLCIFFYIEGHKKEHFEGNSRRMLLSYPLLYKMLQKKELQSE
jgi:hypothetical protein